MRDNAKRTIRVRASIQIVRMKLLRCRAKQDQKYAQGSQENFEALRGPRLGLPREHAIQMLTAGEEPE
jgi:hypothetical protein